MKITSIQQLCRGDFVKIEFEDGFSVRRVVGPVSRSGTRVEPALECVIVDTSQPLLPGGRNAPGRKAFVMDRILTKYATTVL